MSKALTIERQMTNSSSWEQWQLYADDCQAAFSLPNNGLLATPTSVNCLQFNMCVQYISITNHTGVLLNVIFMRWFYDIVFQLNPKLLQPLMKKSLHRLWFVRRHDIWWSKTIGWHVVLNSLLYSYHIVKYHCCTYHWFEHFNYCDVEIC